MAVPKNRVSKQRARTRRAHFKLTAPVLSECPQCHQMKLSHRACKNCGHYNGRLVVEQKDSAAK